MTIVFWLVVIALTAGTLLMLVRPLLKASQPAEREERRKHRSVYRQQFRELRQDFHCGAIGREPYRQARRELMRRLLEESGTTKMTPPPRQALGRRLPVLTIAVCLPVASVLLYLLLGNPLAMTHPVPQEPQTADRPHLSATGLDVLAERLKRKLERNPGDGRGWALLARSYVELDRHAASVPAFEKAVKLISGDAQLLVDYADALGMVNGRKLDGRPAELIHKALEIDPNNTKALLLAGTIAFRQGDYAGAVEQWEAVIAGAPPGSQLADEVRASIAEARSLLGGDPTTLIARGETPGTAVPHAISGTVSLAPTLAGKVAPTDTLFVFARSADGAPMPVAVVRASPKDLPFTFRLDDSNSVMPGRRLSEAGKVVVVARVSKTGTAMSQAGDLQGISGTVGVGSEGVNITIDTELR